MIKFKKETYIGFALLFVVAAVLATGIYFSEDRPPELDLNRNLFQGIALDEEGKYFNFEDEHFENISKFTNTVERDAGVTLYYNTSFYSLLESIKPQKETNFIFFTYDPRIKNFRVFPNNVFKNTASLNYSYPILRSVFGVISDKPYETMGSLRASDDVFLLGYFDDYCFFPSGWNLIPVGDTSRLNYILNSCKGGIESVWVQNGSFNFEKVNLDFPYMDSRFNIAWIKITEGSPGEFTSFRLTLPEPFKDCLLDEFQISQYLTDVLRICNREANNDFTTYNSELYEVYNKCTRFNTLRDQLSLFQCMTDLLQSE
ncbi:hypothetical protein GF354_03710 [Candidatus Peregrinibacteria bacterium]|nr:hypothetical protein [Candidatus Peregrinibacteria bacterium]